MSEDGARVKISRPAPKNVVSRSGCSQASSAGRQKRKGGLYPIPIEDGGSIGSHIEAVRRMLADLPEANERRSKGDGTEAASLPQAQGMPDYYAQNFHFQSEAG